MDTQDSPSAKLSENPVPGNLPDSKLVLLLGILSLVLCWWHIFSITGFFVGLFALVRANRSINLYHANLGKYSVSSLNNIRAGRICALIGLAISAIVLSFIILMLFGILATLPFWGMIN